MLGTSRSGYRPGLLFWATIPVVGYSAWVYYNRHHRRLTVAGEHQSAVDRDWVDRQNRLGDDVRRSGGGV
ncbi:hypothetical protein BDF22DRAFT_741859 [Syncephalis plumigaleata]|nr:hypothetical protein BDF22DRAFT_741859 [Syncephalis plumigaleata]